MGILYIILTKIYLTPFISDIYAYCGSIRRLRIFTCYPQYEKTEYDTNFTLHFSNRNRIILCN